jgi:pyruvate dehydrogenase E1 component beta subunit
MVTLALKAAEELAAEGVDAEVLDLRCVDDASLDYESLGRSLRKTGALAVVEQAMRANSIGAKIALTCQQRFFDALDGPVATVNAPDIPIPVSKWLEASCMPTVAQVRDAVRAAALRRV